jgi:hypothetical protein
MGESCGVHGGNEKYIQNFRRETGREETTRKT